MGRRPQSFYLLVCAEGDPVSAGAAAQLAEALPHARLDSLDAAARRLPEVSDAEVPVLVVCPETEVTGEGLRALMRIREDLHVVRVAEPDEARPLGAWFKDLPIHSRQVALVRYDPASLVALVERVGREAARRRSWQQAIRRSALRTQDIQPRPMDLTQEGVQQSLLASLPIGVLVTTADGWVVDANRRARTLLEMAPGEYGHLTQHVPHWERTPDGGSEETLTLTRSGRRYHLLLRVAPLELPRGSDAGRIVTVEDVTEREEARQVLRAAAEALDRRVRRDSRRLEEAQREREALENLVIALAHDLRSPLAAARMTAELLRRRGDGSDARLDRLFRNLDRTDRMLEDLLDLARHDTGKGMDLELRPVRLDRLVAETVDDLRLVHGRAFDVREPLPPVEGIWDPDGLRRIVENLGNNAAKHGDPSRPIEVWITGDDRHASFFIRNWGAPIPLDAQRNLFEPFYRVEPQREGAAPGWGIGLSLVRAMAEEHGGTVTVTSSAEEGTVFGVRLPLEGEGAEGGRSTRASG